MKTSNKPLLFGLAVLLLPAALAAQGKPNFTGTWVLNLEKSNLGGAPVTKVVVQVDHKDPMLKYTAKGVADGQDFEETETLTTDGTPGQDSHGANVKTFWEGATLVSQATGDGNRPLYEARLTLAKDGKSLVRDFIRQSADDPQWRHETYEKQ